MYDLVFLPICCFGWPEPRTGAIRRLRCATGMRDAVFTPERHGGFSHKPGVLAHLPFLVLHATGLQATRHLAQASMSHLIQHSVYPRQTLSSLLTPPCLNWSPSSVFLLPQLVVRKEKKAGETEPEVEKKYGAANGTAAAVPAAGGGGTLVAVHTGGNTGGDTEAIIFRPVCKAAGCERRSRPDSKFCCHDCGVAFAEAMLGKTVRHSLEVRVGLDKARRVRETREAKARKNQVGGTLRSKAREASSVSSSSPSGCRRGGDIIRSDMDERAGDRDKSRHQMCFFFCAQGERAWSSVQSTRSHVVQ